MPSQARATNRAHTELLEVPQLEEAHAVVQQLLVLLAAGVLTACSMNSLQHEQSAPSHHVKSRSVFARMRAGAHIELLEVAQLEQAHAVVQQPHVLLALRRPHTAAGLRVTCTLEARRWKRQAEDEI